MPLYEVKVKAIKFLRKEFTVWIDAKNAAAAEVLIHNAISVEAKLATSPSDDVSNHKEKFNGNDSSE